MADVAIGRGHSHPGACPGAPARPPVAWWGLLVVVAADAALFMATAARYGYHRDELYFRMLAAHPAWGYVDQPGGTPMIARVGITLLGDSIWALRVPAMLFALGAVVLTALLVRELGGASPAQLLAAVGVSSAFLLISGHTLLTSTPDLVVWLAVLLFSARALLRRQPRWWLAVGATVGVGLLNKQLVVLLLAGIGIGLAIAGPRGELRSPWLWAGLGLAFLIGLPTLVYQVANGWPELTMARALSAHKGADDRTFFVPLQLLLLGITVVPIWVAGLVALLRNAAWRPLRALGCAYPVVAVLTLLTGGQPYYTFGLLVFLFAAGCVVTARWASHRPGRSVLAWTAVGVACLTAVPLALPVIPVRSLPGFVPAVNQAARDTVGWPAYVAEAAAAYRTLPADEQQHAVVLTGNYGEAGAVDRYGPADGLPAVYSGQNELYYLGPPPAQATVAVAVGIEPTRLALEFTSCSLAGTLDDRVGVDNEEQGRPIYLCRGLKAPWATAWHDFQHFD